MPRNALMMVQFQSTLPLRGATQAQFHTLPLRGATMEKYYNITGNGNFNPRSPYGERQLHLPGGFGLAGFQSTLPLRGATYQNIPTKVLTGISIHAPLTGSDGDLVWPGERTCDFNPRSPYGERLLPKRQPVGSKLISIHAPLTGSDRGGKMLEHAVHISIHAPLTGSDRRALARPSRHKDFNPRSPYGERLPLSRLSISQWPFQSTLPLRGATLSRSRGCPVR